MPNDRKAKALPVLWREPAAREEQRQVGLVRLVQLCGGRTERQEPRRGNHRLELPHGAKADEIGAVMTTAMISFFLCSMFGGTLGALAVIVLIVGDRNDW